MLKRLLLSLVVCFCLVVRSLPLPASADEPDLGIGSKAPALDIEHWLQDGNGAFKPVKEFQDGKVYVVEFWATWCGPCIMSMPHLAELQTRYRDQVQIISVTSESVDEVKDLLGKEHPEAGKTFQEITSLYCLTADPDESVYNDYMTASESNGIPNSFVVGKTGVIEWIGHPMSMDDVLEEVIEGTWDREAFKVQVEQDRELQANMEQVARLAGTGKFDESLQLVEDFIEESPTDVIKDHWINIRHNLKLVAKKIDAETTDYFNEQLADMKRNDDVRSVLSFGNMLFGVSQEGGEIGSLGKAAIETLEAFDVEKLPSGFNVVYFNTIALLNELEGDFLKAAEAQGKGVEVADERQKRRMIPYLKELRVKAGLEKPETKDSETKDSETKGSEAENSEN